jgi:hypothetical protein
MNRRLQFPVVFCLVALLTSVSAVAAWSSELNRLTSEEIEDGWLLLFDGESLYGWRPVVEADWKVDGGAIVVTSGKVGLLRTTTQFSDYILKVDFRAPRGTNAGVFLRTSPEPKDPARDCYEVNISDKETDCPTASLVGRKRAEVQAAAGEWHTFEIRAEGGRILIKLDDQEALDYTDPAPPGRGFIGLQHNQGKVEFRNVKLKPLGLDSLFNGKDLSGWVTYPDMESVFGVTPEGWLNVKNGRGQLETKGRFGDFVFQMECITNGEHLNSGIFFRCIPGDVMMGYESQIQNAYIEGDRTRPVDCGTGGIFRRQNARKVMADDFQWFANTIIAEGPHVAVWVNGVQVTDWTDKRAPDENPRRGLRLAPGTIMIQGHDPTTDISFRNLQAGEMAARWPK